jgi:hypothetical protein
MRVRLYVRISLLLNTYKILSHICFSRLTPHRDDIFGNTVFSRIPRALFFPKKLRPKTGVRGLFANYEVVKYSFTPRRVRGGGGVRTSIRALV